jgi:D-sedoheptulose 7-phosphate isomerase
MSTNTGRQAGADNAALADRVRQLFARSIQLKQEVADRDALTIAEMARDIVAALTAGGKLLLCGNGGSAADAQHLAAEMLVRLRPHVNRDAIPAISLATDTSSLTACANDYEYDAYFERMTRALGRPGDVLIGITTSGRSPSVVRALAAARAAGIRTVGLLGGNGQPALAECDIAVVVPSDETGRVQEAHIAIGHALLELVEDLWLSRRAGTQG